jgi:hypothetical protein
MPTPATRRRFQRVREFARRYLAAGWRLIPNYNIYRGRCTCRLKAACAHSGKHPRIAGWSDGTAGQASNDPQVVEGWLAQWPWLNLGLATGPASHPLAEGVDTRGDGGQLIVAPSRNLQGPYHWVPGCAPWDRPPTEAPPALIDLILAKQILVLHTDHPAWVPAQPASAIAVGERPPAELLLGKYMGLAAPGSRNTCGFHLALQFRDNGYSLVEAEPYLLRYQQAVDSPTDRYTVAEALSSLQSAYRHPPRQAWTPRQPVLPPSSDAAAVAILEE